MTPITTDPDNFDLRFVHMDPVLMYHMQGQSVDFIKRSLLDFIHPEERESKFASREVANS